MMFDVISNIVEKGERVKIESIHSDALKNSISPPPTRSNFLANLIVVDI